MIDFIFILFVFFSLMKCNCKPEASPDQTKEFLKIAQQNNVAKLSNGSDQCSLCPFSMILEPYSITEKQFQQMKQLSHLWQKITYLASMDSQLIIKSFSHIVKDTMTGPMIEIYKQLIKLDEEKSKEDKNQSLLNKPKIELFRTDFFITDDKQNNIKLIQYNNMSVSMAGISREFQKCQKKMWGASRNIVQNNCTQTFAKGIIKFYNKSCFSGILLAVVQSNETNIVDQNLLFEQITKNSTIKIEKVFIQNLNKETTIDENGYLYFQNEKKVSIVYYRAGYSSKQKIDWTGVRKCNLSNAINIPDIGSFLTGTKRMQAELSKKEVMKKFLSEQEVEILQKSVIQTWDFQEMDSKNKILQIMEKQGIMNFVLKPNEQGGKNNYFGQDAYKKVKQSDRQQLLSYILTRKIRSRVQNCTLIRSKQWECPISHVCQIEFQISIYGCVCSQCQCKKCSHDCKCGCIKNCCQGFLVRCKPSGVNQGGLMAGTGAIGGLQIIQNI